MTLTTRLTTISLAALAVVLTGFSVALYLLAREHLYRQAEDRLDAATNVLIAAAEIKTDGVEWEPAERQLGFGPGAGGEGVVWQVTDREGQAVDRSVPADAADFLGEAAAHMRATQLPAKKFTWQQGRWLFRQQQVEAGGRDIPCAPPARRLHHKFSALVVTVGMSLEPVRATLRDLAGVLGGVSIGVWALALLAGRRACRWALRPVTRMADAAREMTAANLGHRLPPVATGDELEDLERAFNALLGRVEEAFERQRRFTAEASHQLRTPLTALLGQVEVALRRDRDGDEYRRVLGTVQRQADRLRRVVESLLFLARADADAGLPEWERVDLGAWLPEYIRTAWSGHPRASDIQVNTSSAWADVHPVLLGELTNVLVDNACKYSSVGTPITARVEPCEGGVELSVADAGFGIREEELPRLFEPFVRSAAARERGVEGLGLGLSVAKRIAEVHGGAIGVTRTVGGGSRFTLRLSAVIPPDTQRTPG